MEDRKKELLNYIRKLKKVLDEHIDSQLPIDNEVNKGIKKVCNEIVKTKTILEPQFFNDIYKFMIYLEYTKLQITDAEKYINEINVKYTEERNKLSGLHRTFFMDMANLYIGKIVCELCEAN